MPVWMGIKGGEDGRGASLEKEVSSSGAGSVCENIPVIEGREGRGFFWLFRGVILLLFGRRVSIYLVFAYILICSLDYKLNY